MLKRFAVALFLLVMNTSSVSTVDVENFAAFTSLQVCVSSIVEGAHALHEADSKSAVISSLIAAVGRLECDVIDLANHWYDQDIFNWLLVCVSLGEITDAAMRLRAILAFPKVKEGIDATQQLARASKSGDQNALFLTKAIRLALLPILEASAAIDSFDSCIKSSFARGLVRFISKAIDAKNLSGRQGLYTALILACIGYRMWCVISGEEPLSFGPIRLPPAETVCTVCLDQDTTIPWRKLRRCPHWYHKTCINAWFERNNDRICPQCRRCDY